MLRSVIKVFSFIYSYGIDCKYTKESTPRRYMWRARSHRTFFFFFFWFWGKTLILLLSNMDRVHSWNVPMQCIRQKFYLKKKANRIFYHFSSCARGYLTTSKTSWHVWQAIVSTYRVPYFSRTVTIHVAVSKKIFHM